MIAFTFMDTVLKVSVDMYYAQMEHAQRTMSKDWGLKTNANLVHQVGLGFKSM